MEDVATTNCSRAGQEEQIQLCAAGHAPIIMHPLIHMQARTHACSLPPSLTILLYKLHQHLIVLQIPPFPPEARVNMPPPPPHALLVGAAWESAGHRSLGKGLEMEWAWGRVWVQ